MSSQQIASKIALFQQIYIPYPPHTTFHEQCEYLV